MGPKIGRKMRVGGRLRRRWGFFEDIILLSQIFKHIKTNKILASAQLTRVMSRMFLLQGRTLNISSVFTLVIDGRKSIVNNIIFVAKQE